ncbi:histone deacetylase [Candidatus Bathyarchaeota archaeon]|nr:MAG: histone deacetylase [Candidatus Bathyarchaeota archaeon]
MEKTAIIYTPRYLEHDAGPGHPESSDRLRAIMKELRKSGLLESGKCMLIEPKPASVKDVELIHQPDYIQLVKRVCSSGGGLLDLGDTVVSPKSYETALYAVGGAVKAADLVMNGEFQNAFALVRPPGHHAGPSYAMGFCLFNNVAVVAAHLLGDFRLKRILILDVDAHHGNGTQDIFYNTNEVLYIGLHQDPRGFPGTGFVDDVGSGDGLGYTVNIPFPYQTDDAAYLKAFNQVVIPIIRQYKPEFILVSTGFDGHYTDPVASLSLSASTYPKIFGKVLDLASQFCMGRLVAVLEGGYSLSFIGKIAAAVIGRMAGVSYLIEDKHLVAAPEVGKQVEKTIMSIRRAHSKFWDL